MQDLDAAADDVKSGDLSEAMEFDRDLDDGDEDEFEFDKLEVREDGYGEDNGNTKGPVNEGPVEGDEPSPPLEAESKDEASDSD